jgi:hypothetical protein
MNLHSNKDLLQDAILAAAEVLDMREIYVEKDYWVTVALYEIFHSEIGDQSVFKGGTALSKCYSLIDRFSEDIDIVVLRNEGEKDSKLAKKIKEISKVLGKVIPEITVDGLTNKKGNIRKTVHQYNKIFEGDFGQVREQIVVEATWLGNFEPYSEMPVSSYVYDMMNAKGLKEMIAQYNMAPFTIKVLSKLRTFCEKIMSLVRFSRTEDPITDLRNKVRHVYDIHQMLKDEEVQEFFNSVDFDQMMIKVANDDMIGYKNNNEWIPEHPSTALIFAKPQDTWEKLSTAYNGGFKDLVTGELPAEGELIETLKKVAAHLKEIEWTVK